YRNEKPDIVFHFTIKPNIYGSFAAKLVKIRCANTISGLGFIFTKKNLLSPFVNILYRIACGFSEKSFFHNKEDMELFISNNIIIPLKACHVNGSGINSDYFAPMKPEGKDSTSRGFRLLYIGRMLWDKGLGELIEAVKISKETFPKLTLRLVGPIDNGNPAGISMRTIQEWQSSGLLEYLGEKEDVRPFIADSDCVILPSHREGLPRVLLEASAMQKPAIASSIAGCRDIIKDGINGFLCPPKDSLKLAEAIIRMASLEKQNRDEMGRRGRQKVIGEFSENRVIGLYLDALGL
ncbi:MAG: glycosyltransferase family 4 protein, partial [Candidatus Omnitrophica bacterium]|nr:glycosyltransferase family 4 protein [Candidatus Omnitrophota bacterium]